MTDDEPTVFLDTNVIAEIIRTQRVLLVDASVFITLAGIEAVDLLSAIRGRVFVPAAVMTEVSDEPAASRLDAAVENGEFDAVLTEQYLTDRAELEALRTAATHLGERKDEGDWSGDVTLLALGLAMPNPVVVTDDKPLRKTCKALGVPLSGSIGVVIAAVERDALESEGAKQLITAMDEVGARLSARLFRKAERLIDEAAEG